MRRRTLLTAVGAGTVSLAGCLTGAMPSDGDASTDDLPAECPVSQDYDVTWPEDFDAATVETFVEAYERVHYREAVVDYEPETSLDAYELDGGVTDPPADVGDGWQVTYSGSGAVYRPTLVLDATTAEAPADADVVALAAVDDERLTALLEEAAETGDAEMAIERDQPGEVERYAQLLASLSSDFEPLDGRGDADSLYVDVDGSTVELSASATTFHGDYWWSTTYYVDERVVWRADGEEADPRDGELLECRLPE